MECVITALPGEAIDNSRKTFSNKLPENHEQQENVADDCKTENRLREAAIWLAANYGSIAGNPVPALMVRFKISVHDAVIASKRAHALRFPRAAR